MILNGQMKAGLNIKMVEDKFPFIEQICWYRFCNYIKWEITPTFIGSEKLICISGGIGSPI